DYIGMPAVVFSDPEMASVGYTEQQAKDEKIDVKVGKFPFAANGRALSLNETEGSMKLITRKEDGLVIGGQIVEANASDMIAEVGLAIDAVMSSEDIALTVLTLPSLGAITMDAAYVALGKHYHTIYNE